MTVVIIQRAARRINPTGRYHVVASRGTPTAPQATGAHRSDVEKSRCDRLIENWGRKLDKRQEIRHLVGEARSPAMRQCLDGGVGLPVTYIKHLLMRIFAVQMI